MSIGADVFIGKITKDFNSEKGFKGQLTMSDGASIFIMTRWEGKTKEFLKENVGKTVALMGDLRFPGRDAKTKIPILEVRGKVNGGGMITKRGRLTKDAELAYTPNGKQYAKFSIAVNYGYGENQEADFIYCTLWGDAGREKNPAVTLAEKGTKGRELLVKGRLQIGKDRDGNPFPSLTATDFQFIGNKPDSKNNESDPDLNVGWEDLGTQISIEEDEIPF